MSRQKRTSLMAVILVLGILLIALPQTEKAQAAPRYATALQEGRTYDQAHNTGYIDWGGSVGYTNLYHRSSVIKSPDEGGQSCVSGCTEPVTVVNSGGSVSGNFQRDVTFFDVMFASESSTSGAGVLTVHACGSSASWNLAVGSNGVPGFSKKILSVPAGCRSWTASMSGGHGYFRSTDVTYVAPPTATPTATLSPAQCNLVSLINFFPGSSVDHQDDDNMMASIVNNNPVPLTLIETTYTWENSFGNGVDYISLNGAHYYDGDSYTSPITVVNSAVTVPASTTSLWSAEFTGWDYPIYGNFNLALTVRDERYGIDCPLSASWSGEPTPTPTKTATITPTPTITYTPSPTSTGTLEPTSTVTPALTPSATSTGTLEPTSTATYTPVSTDPPSTPIIMTVPVIVVIQEQNVETSGGNTLSDYAITPTPPALSMGYGNGMGGQSCLTGLRVFAYVDGNDDKLMSPNEGAEGLEIVFMDQSYARLGSRWTKEGQAVFCMGPGQFGNTLHVEIPYLHLAQMVTIPKDMDENVEVWFRLEPPTLPLYLP